MKITATGVCAVAAGALLIAPAATANPPDSLELSTLSATTPTTNLLLAEPDKSDGSTTPLFFCQVLKIC